MHPLFPVLFEDADLLAINKPAGLVCHPTKGDQYSSLISRVRLYLGTQAQCALINRLDRETSGVTLASKNPQAAGKAGKLLEARAVRKVYWAIVHGFVPQNGGMIDAPLGKDEKSIVAVKDCVRADGSPARTEFSALEHFRRQERDYSLVQIIPHTGRKHQIRIHLASIGHPIVGDKLYGEDEDHYLALAQNRLTDAARQRLILPHHALHARSLSLFWGGEEKTFVAEPEPFFSAFAAGE